MNNFRHIFSNFYINVDLVKKDPTFLHIGSISGNLETKLNELFPDCKIFSVEPHPQNFKILTEGTKNIKNITLINKALVSDERNKALLDKGQSNAPYHSGATTYRTKQGFPVEATNLKKLFKEYNIKEVDCIFYNAEGSEMDFLPYIIENSFHRQVRQICLNFHVHVPAFKISYEDVDNLFKNINIRDYYKINDDRVSKIATKATGKPLSRRYPCFLFYKP